MPRRFYIADEDRDWLVLIVGLTVGALALAMIVTVVEYELWSLPVLPNEAPAAGVYWLARSGFAALVSITVISLIARRAAAAVPGRALAFGEALPGLLSLLSLALLLVVFLWSPRQFSVMSLEDGPVEWASAILPVAGSFLLLWCGGRELLQSCARRENPWLGALILACAALLFVLGMEEISWMQRVFHIATPESLKGNIQGEFNFHNLATNQIGFLHKIGGFVFLVFLPFLHAAAPQAIRNWELAKLVPGRGVAMVAAPLAALNYNGWDALLMQMTSYLTIGVMIYFALGARKAGRAGEMILCALMAAMIILAQGVFLSLGDRFLRIWDITEYKELYIAIGLFVWAVETFDRRRSALVTRPAARMASASTTLSIH